MVDDSKTNTPTLAPPMPSVEEQAKAAIDRLLRFPRWTREGEPMERTVERTALVMDVLSLVQRVNLPLPKEKRIPLLQLCQGWEDLIAQDKSVVSKLIARFNQQNYRAPNPRKVRAYAAKMAAGLIAPEVKYEAGMEIGEQWREGHVMPMTVDEFGDFTNGQTRTFAVGLFIEEHPGAIVRMRIRLGIHPLDAEVIDVLDPRDDADALDFAGFPRDPNKVVTSRKAQDVADKARMGLRGGKRAKKGDEDKEVTKSNKKEAHKQVARPYWSLIFHVIYALARVDFASVVFTPTSIDAATNYKKTKTRRARWRTDVAAAFFKAAFEYPLASVLAAATRFANENWIPNRDDDPLKLLNFKLQTKSRQKRVNYPFVVEALRAELQGRFLTGLKELKEAKYDFTAPWEPGYVPLAEHENRRRAHKVVLARYATNPDVIQEVNGAADVLAHARAKGMVFSVVGEGNDRELSHPAPDSFPDRLARLVNDYEEAIRELVLEELQPAASPSAPVSAPVVAVPAAVKNNGTNGHGELTAAEDAGAGSPPMPAV